MGGKSGSKDTSASRAQAEIARALFAQSQPIRNQIVDLNSQFLGLPSGTRVESRVRNDNVFGIPTGTDLVTLQDPTQTNSVRPFDVSSLPQFHTLKDVTESQFGNARKNIIESTPQGGALVDKLAGLEVDRATNLSRGSSQIAQDQLNQAFQLATGMTSSAQQGLGSAAATQAQMAANEASTKGSKGQAAGTIAASALLKTPTP